MQRCGKIVAPIARQCVRQLAVQRIIDLESIKLDALKAKHPRTPSFQKRCGERTDPRTGIEQAAVPIGRWEKTGHESRRCGRRQELTELRLLVRIGVLRQPQADLLNLGQQWIVSSKTWLQGYHRDYCVSWPAPMPSRAGRMSSCLTRKSGRIRFLQTIERPDNACVSCSLPPTQRQHLHRIA